MERRKLRHDGLWLLLAGRLVLLAYGFERFVVDVPWSLSRFTDGRLHLSVEVHKLYCRLGLGLTVGMMIQCQDKDSKSSRLLI